jgi:hypothetical protein
LLIQALMDEARPVEAATILRGAQRLSEAAAAASGG